MDLNAHLHKERTMTKNRIIGAIAALSLLTVPAVAVAHGSGDDRGNHNGRHHHNHHGKKAKKTRDVTGSATGTVASFTNGELTIALPNGKSFTADVKRRTVIRCKSAPVVPATVARHGDDDGNGRGGRDDGPNHDAGDDHGDHPATTTAPATTTVPASTTTPSTTVPPTTDDHGNDDHNNGHGARCGTAALVAGTRVATAKLSLKGGSATWKKVVLLK
jgi:cell division septation protein DedD